MTDQTVTSRVVEASVSPAMTLIFRAAMGISVMTVMWFASELMSHKDDHAISDLELAVSLERLSNSLDVVEQRTSDRYTGKDAEEDLARIDNRLSTLASFTERRIDALQTRIRELELQRR